jgi:hypothetical protein
VCRLFAACTGVRAHYLDGAITHIKGILAEVG